ncbi:MAG: hypothetical protein J4451_02250 [DPANN group archaeon]|nr:hypothetical protein [DPANN group archaeon]
MATNKNNIVLLTIILAGVFLVSGCAQPQQQKTVDFGFPTGQDAVSLNFEANQPPATVISGEEFPIAVTVKNIGGSNINSVNVILEGLGSSYKVTPGFAQSTGELLGRVRTSDKNEIPGSFESVVFDVTPMLLSGAQALETHIYATAIYPFETTAVSTLCVSSKQQSSGQKSICNSVGKKDVGTKAGPIKVTSIDQARGTVLITVENVGKGDPFVNIPVGPKEPKYGPSLLPGDISPNSEKDRIELTKVELGANNKLIDCGAPKEIRLIDGKASFSCKTTFDNVKAEAAEPLVLTFNYGYMQQVDKIIKLEQQ